MASDDGGAPALLPEVSSCTLGKMLVLPYSELVFTAPGESRAKRFPCRIKLLSSSCPLGALS
jgi:hypothetical protein